MSIEEAARRYIAIAPPAVLTSEGYMTELQKCLEDLRKAIEAEDKSKAEKEYWAYVNRAKQDLIRDRDHERVLLKIPDAPLIERTTLAGMKGAWVPVFIFITEVEMKDAD